MNTCVQAGVLIISVKAEMISATVSTKRSPYKGTVAKQVETTCLHHFNLSLNGHSISAINPELVLTGGMATSAMA
tara:strand:+ start:384 stop:608 length:225 start_codon:yes stop_codon:yes gene_type:complete